MAHAKSATSPVQSFTVPGLNQKFITNYFWSQVLVFTVAK